jgi:DTW domain-containing protein
MCFLSLRGQFLGCNQQIILVDAQALAIMKPAGHSDAMSRRSNGAARCQRCKLHKNVCICALMPVLQTRTRLLLLIHRDELRKPTNTGQLAALCLSNSEVVCRNLQKPQWAEQSQPLFLFPHPDAMPLTEWVKSEKPITLIVPDGTWRQASKTRNRTPELRNVPCVSLPAGDRSTYRLRTEHRDDGLATMEAIARAFGLLEGADVERALSNVFRHAVDRTLWVRGSLAADRVFGGIPPGAQRHDPIGLNRSCFDRRYA